MRVIRASRLSWRAAAWLVRNHRPCERLRREREEQSDRETAESLNRMHRYLREGDPTADVRTSLHGGRKTVERVYASHKDQQAELERLNRVAKELGM